MLLFMHPVGGVVNSSSFHSRKPDRKKTRDSELFCGNDCLAYNFVKMLNDKVSSFNSSTSLTKHRSPNWRLLWLFYVAIFLFYSPWQPA